MELIFLFIMALTAVYALIRGVNVYDALCSGAAEGIATVGRMLPALVCLLPAVAMLRESGAMDAFTVLLRPLTEGLGIPEETALLLLLRPLSGSAALAAGGEIMESFGPDSLIGRTTAVMLGSTETTFYVISVYFTAAGVKKSRHAVPAALCADFAGFLTAAWAVRLFYSSSFAFP
ncbi:MAG: spore maturation protein [Ruminococcaceae bacterium]|nr:spore maturation protein [Oscillospiraceae bacterium]